MNMIHDFPATTRQNDLLATLETLLHGLQNPPTRRTARLVGASTDKKARKLVEEATEVALDAVTGNRDGMIEESVDLLYHLAVLWHDQGVSAEDIRAEMARRSEVLGIAEKLPKKGKAKAALKRLPRALPAGRARSAMLYRDGARIGPVSLSEAAAR